MKLDSIVIPAFLEVVLSYTNKWLHLELVEQVDQVQTLEMQLKHE